MNGVSWPDEPWRIHFDSILFGSFNMFKILLLALSTSVQDFAMTPVMRDLHWLHVSFRIEFKIMLITNKVLHDRAPIYTGTPSTVYTQLQS